MKYRGLYSFAHGAACAGFPITFLLLAMGSQTAWIGVWTLINLVILLYVIRARRQPSGCRNARS